MTIGERKHDTKNGGRKGSPGQVIGAGVHNQRVRWQRPPKQDKGGRKRGIGYERQIQGSGAHVVCAFRPGENERNMLVLRLTTAPTATFIHSFRTTSGKAPDTNNTAHIHARLCVVTRGKRERTVRHGPPLTSVRSST